MPQSTHTWRESISATARREWRELVTFHPSERPWELPFAVAVASGLPLLFGAWFGNMGYGALASICGITVVYLPRTRLRHSMITITAAAFGMTACYLFGQLSQFLPAGRAPIIGLVAIFLTMACRYFRIGPPGSLFFIMATAIGAYTQGDLAAMPSRVAVFALGGLGAVAVAFLYKTYILRFTAPLPAPAPPEDLLNTVVIDPILIGAFVGLSLGVAQILALDKPYWVPVSCLAVIQGISLRAVWNRQAHRILGTAIGLGVTWVLLHFATGPWTVAIAVTGLTFCVETAIVRNYGFATIFITPLTILLAEASTLGDLTSSALIEARFLDTVVGALIGGVGGVCLHSPAIRQMLARLLHLRMPDQTLPVTEREDASGSERVGTDQR